MKPLILRKSILIYILKVESNQCTRYLIFQKEIAECKNGKISLTM